MTPYDLALASEGAYLLAATIKAAGVEVRITALGTSLIVAFRGTEKNWADILTDIKIRPTWASGFGWVHRGFYTGVTVIWPQVLDELHRIGVGPGNVHFTGHSKGGAEATIAAVFAMKEFGEIGSLVTFGKPRCGFNLIARLGGQVVRRFVNGGDPVPRVPLPILFYRHEVDAVCIGAPETVPPALLFERHRMVEYIENVRSVT